LLSPFDVVIIGGIALLVFGPEQLPKVARKVGTVVRDMQTTSQSFIREMERAADEAEFRSPPSATERVVENEVRPAPEPFVHDHTPPDPVDVSPAETEPVVEASEPAYTHPMLPIRQPTDAT
jgi:TatA/E family protein of Tat protein translocase